MGHQFIIQDNPTTLYTSITHLDNHTQEKRIFDVDMYSIKLDNKFIGEIMYQLHKLPPVKDDLLDAMQYMIGGMRYGKTQLLKDLTPTVGSNSTSLTYQQLMNTWAQITQPLSKPLADMVSEELQSYTPEEALDYLNKLGIVL